MSKTSACDGSSEFKVTLRKEHLNKAYHSGHYNKPQYKVAQCTLQKLLIKY